MTTISASGMPTATDSAQGSSTTSSDSGNGTSTSSLVNYYFVFLALILCVAGLGVFLIWRKRRRAVAYTRYSREHALARDVNGWQHGEDGRGGGYMSGYRAAFLGRETVGHGASEREEGLNELGEAPPAYVPPPKTREEVDRETGVEGPAVPMQTLSREHAGLKPPDYAEMSVHPVNATARHSSASGSQTAQDAHANESGEPSSS
ncbi:hypothetical protein LTR85_011247 [Meristemomyces frigidus]|nr:hypothetical protein LTR85_011247 [Meristemomyces frigidus]